jgi:hypothetical protein
MDKYFARFEQMLVNYAVTKYADIIINGIAAP